MSVALTFIMKHLFAIDIKREKNILVKTQRSGAPCMSSSNGHIYHTIPAPNVHEQRRRGGGSRNILRA